MGRPPKDPPSPTPLVPALVRLVRARGGDAELLALRFGLPPAVEELDEVPVGAALLEELLEAAAEALGEPFLALALPEQLPFRRYLLGELAARAAGSLGEALARLARYGGLIHPELQLVVERDADEARWILRTPGRPRGLGRHLHEYALMLALAHCRRELPEPLPVSRVWFAHARPPEIDPLRRHFGTDELVFGEPESGWALPAAILDRPTRAPDPRLLATVEELAEAQLRQQPHADDFAARVAAELRSLLPEGVQVARVAHALHMSPRTLQRRLEQQGRRFSEVLDDVRQERARSWVADPTLPLGEVAYRLGFSELAAFSRAFRRWTGQPPGLWRRSR